MAIGVNAAIISVVTEWLSDLKLGRCSNGWWLNRKFCCWEIEVEGSCDDWLPWTHWSIITYFAYVLLAMTFGGSAGYLVRSFAPFAAGSGISEIKCMLAGFLLDGYLGLSTLAIKSITLVRRRNAEGCLTLQPLAIASGLSVGKEGPSVHVACAIGNVVARGFQRFNRSEGASTDAWQLLTRAAKMREIVTAASAAGVAVAFGSPIGGVLFSLEVRRRSSGRTDAAGNDGHLPDPHDVAQLLLCARGDRDAVGDESVSHRQARALPSLVQSRLARIRVRRRSS